MILHERDKTTGVTGKLDRLTRRYVPMGGGSTSRLPVSDDKRYPRYRGNMGLDERYNEQMARIDDLYQYLGGLVEPTDDFLKQVLELDSKKLESMLAG